MLCVLFGTAIIGMAIGQAWWAAEAADYLIRGHLATAHEFDVHHRRDGNRLGMTLIGRHHQKSVPLATASSELNCDHMNTLYIQTSDSR